jgi:hypothetical protein
MTKKVADLLVDVLAEAGVRRIYGVVGDSLNGITDAIRVKNNLEWVHVARQELAMSPTITLEQAKGFSLFMLRAVLNGRGDEIIDLARVNLLR